MAVLAEWAGAEALRIKPAQTMESGWLLSKRLSKPTARAVITETGIFAAAARREAEGSGSDVSKSDSESEASGCEVGELSSGEARNTDRLKGSKGRIVILCLDHLFDRSYSVNHKYPRTAETEGSNGVK